MEKYFGKFGVVFVRMAVVAVVMKSFELLGALIDAGVAKVTSRGAKV